MPNCIETSISLPSPPYSYTFIAIFKVYAYVCFNYSVPYCDLPLIFCVSMVIRFYVSVPTRFAWCVHTCDLMFKGLRLNIHTYLYFLSIHTRHCHGHIHLWNICMHLPFPSVRSSSPSLSVPTLSTKLGCPDSWAPRIWLLAAWSQTWHLAIPTATHTATHTGQSAKRESSLDLVNLLSLSYITGKRKYRKYSNLLSPKEFY